MRLRDKKPPPRPRWNKVPEKVRADVIDLALTKDGAFRTGARVPLHR